MQHYYVLNENIFLCNILKNIYATKKQSNDWKKKDLVRSEKQLRTILINVRKWHLVQKYSCRPQPKFNKYTLHRDGLGLVPFLPCY